MKFFNKLSLTKKIIFVIFTVTGMIVFTNLPFVIIYTIDSIKSQMIINLKTQAYLVSEHCQAPLMFEDMAALKNNLNVLSQTPDISDAYIYSSEGELLAAYRNEQLQPPAFEPENAVLNQFNGGYLIIKKSIESAGKAPAQLYLRASALSHEKRIRAFLFWRVFNLLLSFVLAYFLARRLQASVSRPILNLAGIIRKISDSKDFSIRVHKQNEDEVGHLYDGFNDMLEQIQLHEQERNRAGQILRDSENRFQSLIQSASDAIIVSDESGIIRMWNKGAVSMFGYEADEIIGKPIADLMPELYRSRHTQSIQRVASGGKSKLIGKSLELEGLKKNGGVFPIELVLSAWQAGEKMFFAGIIRDISERKKAEETLSKSEEKYRSLIEQSGDAIYLLYNRRFELINKKFSEIFGLTLEEVNTPGFDFINLVAPKSRAYIEERVKRSAAGEELEPKYEFTALDAKGNEIIVETSVTYLKYGDGVASQGIIRDITERNRLEAQLQQVQKMESIGTLAGGVAHDFNNLLTVINGYAEIALMKMKAGDPLHKDMSSILSAGKRAENLTRQLLAFSRKQIYKTEILDINRVVASMDKMLRRLIGEDINIETSFSENLPNIKADQSQLEQIFINLVVNARDALYEQNKPAFQKKITIETGSVLLDSEYISKHPGSAAGRHILFAVSDNGVGMDENTRQKLFEPFFTTKKQGKGTGLGLSMVYGIVKQNNGSIYVYSEPGQGSTFKIYWPATEEESVIAEESVSVEIPGGSETILIVEDEKEVCRFAAKSLTSLGYNVLKAENGRVALELLKSEKPVLDLIITDLVMPELSGKEFIEQAKQFYPQVKVIFVSGYTDNHIVHNGLLEEGVNFVQKPYSLKFLSSIIREVLDEK
jgi:PAS domain S-box-containing protein